MIIRHDLVLSEVQDKSVRLRKDDDIRTSPFRFAIHISEQYVLQPELGLELQSEYFSRAEHKEGKTKQELEHVFRQMSLRSGERADKLRLHFYSHCHFRTVNTKFLPLLTVFEIFWLFDHSVGLQL